MTVSVGDGADSATSGTDYAAVTDFTVTIPAGRTSGSAPFTLTPAQDTLIEGNETITVGGAATGSLTVNGTSLTLTDDDGPPAINLSVSPSSVGEGDGATPVTVTAAFSNASTYPTDTTVTVSVGDGADSATSGTDYAAVTDFTVTIPAGRTSGSAPFTLTPAQDTLIEGNETITVGGAATGSLTVNGTSLTLTDDDGPPAINLSVSPSSVGEGDGATPVTVTAAFSNASTYPTDTTVTVSVGDGADSATSGTDYAAVTDFTVTIPAGRTSGSAPFTLTPVDDTLVEGTEIVSVDGTATGLTVNGADVALTDDDSASPTESQPTESPPTIDLSASPSSVSEGAGATAVTVTATFSNAGTYPTDTTVTVSVGDSADSATSGTDYAAVTDFTVTIPAGRTSGSAPFTLTPVDDTLVEGTEIVGVDGTATGLTVNGADVALTDDDSAPPTESKPTENQPTESPPTIDLSASPSSVSEGAGATAVTVTATFSNAGTYPTDTTVTVSVGDSADSATSGTDYAAVSDFTITIPADRTSGSAPFTLTPVDDTLVEGTEIVSVDGTATGLTVNGADVALTDDDSAPPTENQPTESPPTIDLSASPSSVSEGTGATPVTVTATFSNAGTYPTDTTVTVSVGDGADSATSGTDYAAVTDFTVTIPAGRTSGSAPFTLTPAADGVVEGDETITASGTAPDVEVTGTKVTLLDAAAASASVSDATVEEGKTLVFTVTLDTAPSPGGEVTVDYATRDGTATAGEDYESVSGTLAFAAGETEHTVQVPTLDDALNEGPETLTLRLSGGVNATLADPEGVGTITNDDELPAAWIARYGRTVARHVMGAVDARLHGGAVGPHLTIGGVTGSWPGSPGNPGGWPAGFGDGAGGAAGWFDWRGPGAGARDWNVSAWEDPMGIDDLPRAGESEKTVREVLAESAFRWTSGASGDGAPGSAPRWTAWGSGAATRFDGRERSVTLDGEVTGVTVGLDAEWERWTAGMALGWNDARSSYDDAESGDRGTLGSTLTSLHPYLRWSDERWSVWGMVGHGQGEYTAKPEKLGKTIRTDLGMNMAGAGARRTLVPADAAGGLELALRSDAMFVWMDADRVPGYLRETRTRTSHVRLLVEGGWTFALDQGARLVPSVELGLRHDAGDAETGLGIEVGGQVRYEDPTRGLTMEARGRGLFAHEAEDFEVWGASGSVVLDPGSDRRGLSFTVRPVWGVPESGTADLWERGAADAGAETGNDATPARLDTELGYGVSALGGRGVFTARSALGWSSDGARTLGLGGTLDTDGAFELSLVGERMARTGGGEPEYGLELRARVRW